MFPADNYLLMVDPSAYYSVVFLTQDLDESTQLIPKTYINYTSYGGEDTILNGYWRKLVFNVNSTNNKSDSSQITYQLVLNCFVAVN